MIETQVQILQDQIDGLLVDRGRIIDHLLDLRLASVERPDVIVVIDGILTDVPGLTVVEGDWWAETLETLLAVAKKVPAAK